MGMAARPSNDGYERWGSPTISPSPHKGIGMMGQRPGPGLNQAIT